MCYKRLIRTHWMYGSRKTSQWDGPGQKSQMSSPVFAKYESVTTARHNITARLWVFLPLMRQTDVISGMYFSFSVCVYVSELVTCPTETSEHISAHTIQTHRVCRHRDAQRLRVKNTPNFIYPVFNASWSIVPMLYCTYLYFVVVVFICLIQEFKKSIYQGEWCDPTAPSSGSQAAVLPLFCSLGLCNLDYLQMIWALFTNRVSLILFTNNVNFSYIIHKQCEHLWLLIKLINACNFTHFQFSNYNVTSTAT